ncbi:MAG: biopolymer transporter ExbD [Pseudomonadota bacterium]
MPIRRENRAMFRRRRRDTTDDERILPLINIVFLLLIFFMVAGRLSADDPFEILPTYSASDGPLATDPMLVAVGPNGELALNGALIDEAALIAQLSAPDATGEIRVKSDGRIEAVRIVALLEKFRLAGIASVRLMTVPTRGAAASLVAPAASPPTGESRE